MNRPIKVELCFEMIKNRITMSEFTWDFRDFIFKFMCITRVWKSLDLDCPDIGDYIKNILINFTKEKEQLGHILMIIIKLMMGKNIKSEGLNLPIINLKTFARDEWGEVPLNYLNFYNRLNESIYSHVIDDKLSIIIKPRIQGQYMNIYMSRDYDEDLIKILDWTEENCDEHYLDVVDVICTRPEKPKTDSSDIIVKGIVSLINNSSIRMD